MVGLGLVALAGEVTRVTAVGVTSPSHARSGPAPRPADLRSGTGEPGNLRSSDGPRYCYVHGTARRFL